MSRTLVGTTSSKCVGGNFQLNRLYSEKAGLSLQTNSTLPQGDDDVGLKGNKPWRVGNHERSHGPSLS
jgi:hypothetical protein